MKTKNEKITYTNRYDDEFTFEQISKDEILWSGDFNYYRYGFANDYSKAYDEYWHDLDEEKIPMTIAEFIIKVHEYDEKTYIHSDFSKRYSKFVLTDITTIDMVDPSGGPYVAVGMDLVHIHSKWAKKIVKGIRTHSDGGYIIEI